MASLVEKLYSDGSEEREGGGRLASPLYTEREASTSTHSSTHSEVCLHIYLCDLAFMHLRLFTHSTLGVFIP